MLSICVLGGSVNAEEVRLSTTGMQLVSMGIAGQIAMAPRCKCWVLDRLMESCSVNRRVIDVVQRELN